MNGLVSYANSDDEDGRTQGRASSSRKPITSSSSKKALYDKIKPKQSTPTPGPQHLEAAMPALNLNQNLLAGKPEAGIPGGTLSRKPAPAQVVPGISSREDIPIDEDEDEDTIIRRVFRPPPIDGMEDWGIPPPPPEPCDPDLEAKVMKFHLLKRQGKHFNDSLMQSKAFRNPHIYAKLVQFVDIQETATNFPKEMWDPFDVKGEWYSDKLAAKQKEKYEKTTASQAPGQRSRIAFESAKPTVEPNTWSSSSKEPRRYHPYGKNLDGEPDDSRHHSSYSHPHSNSHKDSGREGRQQRQRQAQTAHPPYECPWVSVTSASSSCNRRSLLPSHSLLPMFTPPPSPLPPPFDSEKESYFDIPTNDGDEEEGSDFDQTPYTDTLPSSKERVSVTAGLTSAHHPPTPCQSRRRILIPLIAILLVLVAIASRFNFSDNRTDELDFPPSDPLSEPPAVSTSTHLGAESTTSHAARRKKRGTTVDPVPAAIDKRAESSESPGASSLSPSVSPSKTLTSVVASGLGLSSASSSSTGSAAASSNSTSPAIPDPPFPVPTPFPQPFDTTFGFNFSTSSCQAWFSNSLLSNNSFRACRPFSLLLPASNQFFQAQNNLTLLTSIIGGTCDTTPSEDECVATMEWLTTEIQKETVCSIDISARNSIVLEALDGFLNYKFMKDAGCLVNARTNSYCFVDAVGAASTSDFYFYTLALGTPLPNNTIPSCSTCVQSLMNIYAGQANNTALEISKTYGSAAVKANAVCGAKYAQALSTNAAARRIVGVAWSGVVATLIGVLLTCL